jgi:hypothetical protein
MPMPPGDFSLTNSYWDWIKLFLPRRVPQKELEQWVQFPPLLKELATLIPVGGFSTTQKLDANVSW